MLQGRELVEFARYVRPMKVCLVTFCLAFKTLAHLCVFFLPEYPLRQVVIFTLDDPQSVRRSDRLHHHYSWTAPIQAKSLFLSAPHIRTRIKDASHPTARIRGDNTYNTRLYAAPQALTHSLRDSVCLPTTSQHVRDLSSSSPSLFTPFLSLRCSCACPLTHSHLPSILLAVSSINSSIRSSRTPLHSRRPCGFKNLASASLQLPPLDSPPHLSRSSYLLDR